MPLIEIITDREQCPVLISRGSLQRWREYLPAQPSRVFFLSEATIWDAHSRRLQLRNEQVHLFEGGEERKRLSSVEAAADWLLENGADRSSVLVAFGGGIVGDMAGFLAAIYMRGIPVIQMPTTLLAQVDASIGGKTGVNLTGGKNLIGTFNQPRAVLIDPEVLDTLPERDFRAGLYEVIKAAVIADPELFEFLDQQRDEILLRSPAALDFIIERSVRVKAEVVARDEHESGLRQILNFGHTIGHALEAETAYTRFLHGEAVARGMRGATKLALLTGLLSPETQRSIDRLIVSYGPGPSASEVSPEGIISRLNRDKKARNGDIRFVLPVRIGATQVVSGVAPGAIRSAVEAALE